MRVTFGEWVPMGANQKAQATYNRIYTFLESNDSGIIHIDELEKISNKGGEWGTGVLMEIFSLLDGILNYTNENGQPSEVLMDKMKRKFLIVGSGTWQHIWEAQPSVGFRQDKAEVIEDINKNSNIPRELQNRFCLDILELSPLTAEDIQKIIGALPEKYQLKADESTISRIQNSKQNMRWFEEEIRRLEEKALPTTKPEVDNSVGVTHNS
jgi:hypothetical protein